jgi:hypothetical protein
MPLLFAQLALVLVVYNGPVWAYQKTKNSFAFSFTAFQKLKWNTWNTVGTPGTVPSGYWLKLC